MYYPLLGISSQMVTSSENLFIFHPPCIGKNVVPVGQFDLSLVNLIYKATLMNSDGMFVYC